MNTVEKNIEKVVADYYTVKTLIHYDRPPIEVIDNDKVSIGLDVSVMSNGKRLYKIIPVSTLILFIKDLLGLLSDKQKATLELNYEYL